MSFKETFIPSVRKTFTVIFLVLSINTFGQEQNDSLPLGNNYFRQIKSPQNDTYRAELFSDINPFWEKWNHRGYSYGFDPEQTPMYTTANGIISTPYMIQVRGNTNEKNKKRWGYHVFEGFAKDDKSRITMLVNKHIEVDKPVAELYYFGTEYNHSEKAYNWFRIGSDVRGHSFLFSRDKAVFYGSLKLKNAFTLGHIGKDNIRKDKPKGDPEKLHKEDAKYVNFKELKGSGNGTMFYDKDNGIVVIKIEGEWMELKVKKLPKGVKYEF